MAKNTAKPAAAAPSSTTNATNVAVDSSALAEVHEDTNATNATPQRGGHSRPGARKGQPRGPQLVWTNAMRQDLVTALISTEPPLTSRKIHDHLVALPSFAVAVEQGLMSPKKVKAQVDFLRDRWPDEEKVDGECPLPELEADGREEVEWGSLAALLK